MRSFTCSVSFFERVPHLSIGLSLCRYFSKAISTDCNVRARTTIVTPTTASQGPPTLSSMSATSNGDSTGGGGGKWIKVDQGNLQSWSLLLSRDVGCCQLQHLLLEGLAESLRRPVRAEDNKRKNSSHHYTCWLEFAFSTYTAVVAHFHSDWAPPCLAYTSIIFCLTREVWESVWTRYDDTFCQAAAIDANIHWDHCMWPNIWRSAMVKPHLPQVGGTIAPTA